MSRTASRLVAAVVPLVALALVLATAPASAAPRGEEQRARVFQTWFAGYVATAEWDTCGEDAPLGTLCEWTSITSSLSATRELATGIYRERSPRSPVVGLVHQGTCEVVELDGERTCAIRSERFGRSTTGQVTATPQLDRVTASATGLRLQTWHHLDGDGEAQVDVEATWTGTGQRVRIDERDHRTDRWSMERSTTRGWERSCTATAVVDGLSPRGELVSCSLLRVQQGEVRVFHGPPRS